MSLDPTQLVLARHGNTFRSFLGRAIQGGDEDRPDAQLNEAGTKEASDLGAILANEFQQDVLDDRIVIVTSPLGRCMETALLIQNAFNLKRCELGFFGKDDVKGIYKDLEEIRHGDCEALEVKVRDNNCFAWYEEREKTLDNPSQDWRWQENPLRYQGVIAPEDYPSPEKTQSVYDQLGITIPADWRLFDKRLDGVPVFESAVPRSDKTVPETISDVAERGERVLHQIAESFPNKRVIVVTSGVFMWATAMKQKAKQDGDTTTAFPVYYGGKAGPTYPKTCSVAHWVKGADGLLFEKHENLLEKYAQAVKA